MEGAERLQRSLAALRGGDLVARLEDHAQGLARSHLVVDDEHPRTVAHGCPDAGSDAVKLTSPRACLASSRPPWLSRIRWLTLGPTSMRFSWTTWIGSKMPCSSSGRTSALREANVRRTRSSLARWEMDTAILASAAGVLRRRYQTR